MEEKFITVFSQKDGQEAIREAVLKIKYSFLKPVKIFFLLFTPHYKPQILLETILLTLRPTFILGIQSPLLIFENQIIEKGIIACCLLKEQIKLKDIFVKESDSEIEDIESLLRYKSKDFKDKQFFFSIIPQNFKIFDCLQGFSLSLGNAFNIFGLGFVRKYGNKNYIILNNTIEEGLLGILGSGLEIKTFDIGGFIPIGKPFLLNKVYERENIIQQINNQPAIEIYKHYLDEKIDIFKKNHLFTLYPLITEKNHLINVVECLEDGSFLCRGNVKEKTYAHLSIFHPPSMFQTIKDKLSLIKKDESGLLFMINSLIRKRIIKEYAYSEIETIRQTLSQNWKIIGLYSDFSIFPNFDERKIVNEVASNLLVFLQ